MQLFNNIIAPYIAETFVSSNCFKYAVIDPPPVISSYTTVSCAMDGFNGTTQALLCAPKLDQQSSFFTTGDPRVEIQNTESFQPPFTYSYQCSSSLLTAFAYVFVYRYLISGLLLPTTFMVLKHLQLHFIVKGLNTEHNYWYGMISFALPTLLRLTFPSSEDEHATFHEMDIDHVMMATRHFNRTRMSAGFLVKLASDLAVLLTFGVLFPPLAIVICSIDMDRDVRCHYRY